VASMRAPRTAVRLEPSLRRRFGVGNATGLGMAPFLMRHPALIDRWIGARETALARVRALARAGSLEVAAFERVLARSQPLLAGWRTDDPVQAPRIAQLVEDLRILSEHTGDAATWTAHRPWNALYQWGEQHLSREGQEYLVTLLLEPHGGLVDDLADAMAIDEAAGQHIDGSMSPGAFLKLIGQHYRWALDTDFALPAAQARFWYVSEEKLEPRLGERWQETGADKEQPLAIGRDVKALAGALAGAPEPTLALFLLRHPEHRHAARRIGIAMRHPYGEIRDNVVDAEVRAIDLLRCKLSFFGCTRFDPRSDRWLRITLYQGAPFPGDPAPWPDDWIYGAQEAAA